MPIYMMIFGLFNMNSICGLIAIISISIFLSEKKIKKIIWAIIYMLIFPFIYIIWGIALIFYLVKIKINNKIRFNKKLLPKIFNVKEL